MLPNVISNISGVSGMAIIKAIVNRQHNPAKLAELADTRIKSSKEDVIKSLEGNYRGELLFITS